MDGVIDFNWLGVAFVSDKVPDCEKVEQEVDSEMERLQTEAREQFDKWLDDRGLECVMGVIVKKGSIK